MKNNQNYYITVETEDDPTSPPPMLSSKRRFETKDGFYGRLKPLLRREARDKFIENIQKIFDEQEIGVEILPDLTDDDLKEYGFKQGGLRKAVLNALRK